MVRQSVTVQQFGARGGYAKKIGNHVGKDGKPKPKVFYFLGVDQREACRRADWLKTEWRRLKALGHAVWPKETIDALPWLTEAKEPVPTEPTPWRSAAPISAAAGQAMPKTRSVKVGQLNLKDAQDLFRTFKEGERDRGLISPQRLATLRIGVSKTVDKLGPTTPLSEIGATELQGLVDHWRSRPKSEKTGEAISIDYSETLITNAQTFFNWAGKAKIGYTLPAEFADIFSAPKKIKPKNNAERKAQFNAKRKNKVEVIDVPTLAKFYKAADAELRAWILIALNAAFRQGDISALRTYNLVKKGNRTFLDYDREKTDVEAFALLWPETAAAIEKTKAKPNEGEHVWLRPNGKVLKTVSDKGVVDCHIRRKWNALRTAVGSKATFDQLRDTSATMILQLSGSRDIQAAHEAHSETHKMPQHYAERLWKDVNDWQDKMREAFKDVWAS